METKKAKMELKEVCENLDENFKLNQLLLFNSQLSDIYFEFESGTKIYAHKSVLAAGSSFFKTFFGSIPAMTSVEIKDFDESSFKEILRYIYINEVILSGDNFYVILMGADRYMLPKLKNICITYIEENLNVEYFARYFVNNWQNCKFFIDSERFEQISQNFLEKNTSDFFLTNNLKYLDKHWLEVLLKLDCVNVSEFDLFKLVFKWTQHQCMVKNIEVTTKNQRAELGDLIFLIRFPFMTLDQFNDCIKWYHLLDNQEIAKMFLFFNRNEIEGLKFPASPRFVISNFKQQSNHQQLNILPFYKTIVNTEKQFCVRSLKVCFAANKMISVRGFEVDMATTTLLATITLRKMQSIKKIFEIEINGESKSTPIFVTVDPIQIEANIQYELTVEYDENTPNGYFNRYGDSPYPKTTINGVEFIRTFTSTFTASQHANVNILFCK